MRFSTLSPPYSNFQSSYPTLTINWPGWKEVGMVANLEVLTGSQLEGRGAQENSILNEDGVEAFRRALDSDLSQVIVSPENLDLALARSRNTAEASTQSFGRGSGQKHRGSIASHTERQ